MSLRGTTFTNLYGFSNFCEPTITTEDGFFFIFLDDVEVKASSYDPVQSEMFLLLILFYHSTCVIFH